MELTTDTLKELINQVLTDYGLLLPLPMDAEPDGKESPGVIRENQSLNQKLFYLLSKISDKERANLFRRFGYFTSSQLLNQLSQLKKAEKGQF